MSNTIAVGVDGSAPSRAAIKWGVARAVATAASVELIFVIGQDLSPAGSRDEEEVLRDSNRILAAEAEYARTLAPTVDVTVSLRQGNAMRELITASRKMAMVVVGTHKTGFIRGRVFGSRSIVLAAGARTPVAVIPETAGRKRHGIIVGMDESPAGRAAIRFGAAEAVRTGDSLRLVSAWKLPDSSHDEAHRENDERQDARIRSVLETEVAQLRNEFPSLEVHSRVIRLPAAEALVDASSSASLVVLGNSGPVSDGQGLLGSVAHDVLVNLAGPTIIVHADKVHRHSPKEPARKGSVSRADDVDEPDAPNDVVDRAARDGSHGHAEFAEA